MDLKLRTTKAAGYSKYLIPTDTLFADQWFLNNTGQSGGTAGIDLNLTKVWDEFKGNGVNVAVIDDGFDLSHADLSPNYDTGKDFDFGQNDNDASPVLSDDNHGTATMGLVGADDNGSGSVGVAPDATLIGYRLDFSVAVSTFLTQLTSAISRAATYADVANMSLGINDYGAQATNVTTALESGAGNGRGGLGTNYVVAAGNARGFSPASSLDANADSLTNSRFVSTVAATDHDGFVAPYSSPGANVLVSALGSASGSITTTDRTGAAGENAGDHTNGFAGTSAAAPQVAGVVALMLEANPNLGWRDVKDILALSARHVGMAIGNGQSGSEFYDWQFNGADNWNGGGMHFSNDYGFGLVDALAAVRLAESWEMQNTSANEASVSVTESDVGFIPDNDPAGKTISFDVNNNINIETITINLDIVHSFAADLIITLTSPSGTVSHLLDETAPIGSFDRDWVFSSNSFRGEDSLGTWTLKVSDVFIGDTGAFFSLNFDAFGSSNSNNNKYYVTNELSDYAGIMGHSTLFDDSNGGNDTFNAVAVTSDSTINFTNNTGTVDGTAVTFSGLENILSGDGDDTLTGGATASLLDGGRGEDILRGEAGNDILKGGADNDTLEGGLSHDILNGDDGDDDLNGGAGNDTMDGGAGIDTGRYDSFGGAVTVNLNVTAAQNTGAAGTDTISNIENLIGGIGNDIFTGKTAATQIDGGGGSDKLFGLGGDDILNGDSGNDNIQGGNGNDTLNGGIGRDTLSGGNNSDILAGGAENDQLRGGADSDILTGGGGRDVLIGGDVAGNFPGDGAADTFVFNAVSDSAAGGATRDIVRDFEQGLDKLDFSAIDAITGGVDDAFSFVGSSAFSNTAGELRAFFVAGNTVVRADVDGDGAADLEIFLNGLIAMTTSDFVL